MENQGKRKTKHEMAAQIMKRLNAGKYEDVQAIHAHVFEGAEFDAETDTGINLSEEVTTLLEETDLSDELKESTVVVFEAAVNEKTAERVSLLEDTLDEYLSEGMDTINEEMVDAIDGYLSRAVDQWLAENEVALSNNIREDVAQEFLSDLKQVFESHKFDVPEVEDEEAIASLNEELTAIKDKLNEAVTANIELEKTIHEDKVTRVIEEATSDLADTQVDKIRELVEGMDTTDLDAFKSKVDIVKKNFLGESKEETKQTEKPEAVSYNDVFKKFNL